MEPVQKVLGQIYHPQTVCQVLSAEQVRTCPLSDINETAIQVYIPEQPDDVGLTRFQETIAHLRAPDGCPWDKKQTHQTLRPYLLEETYEVLAAIDEGSAANMADELGDLLLQIVLHAQIAGEAGTFTMTDIVSHIQKKMIRRHPHVFANTSVNSVDDVKRNWDQIKAQEKAEKGELAETPSAMDGVLDALPALVQALDISKKAVKQGFEWDDAQGVLRKLQEEAEEIVTATSPAEIEAEIGDFLFTAVNLARKMGVDAETALRACNTRFMRRFRQLERIAEAQNLTLPEIDKKTWFALWQQAKKEVAHLEK
ncbi:MAG: nucleoside triphosphate pyrophosphohydrolase [Chloroflexota bacterium]